MVDVSGFQREAFNYVCISKPFNFINKYYCIVTGDKKLYSNQHLNWINFNLDKYNQYKGYGFDSKESEAFSMLDTLECIINSIGKLYEGYKK